MSNNITDQGRTNMYHSQACELKSEVERCQSYIDLCLCVENWCDRYYHGLSKRSSETMENANKTLKVKISDEVIDTFKMKRIEFKCINGGKPRVIHTLIQRLILLNIMMK